MAVAFYSVSEYPPKWCTYSTVWLLHGWCRVKLLPSRHVLCTPLNHAQLDTTSPKPCIALHHFTQSHICKVHACYSTVWLLHGWCRVKLLPSRHVLCTPLNHAQLDITSPKPCIALHHFTQSHICKVHACYSTVWLLHGWCPVKLLPSRHFLCTPLNHAQLHITSHKATYVGCRHV